MCWQHCSRKRSLAAADAEDRNQATVMDARYRAPDL